MLRTIDRELALYFAYLVAGIVCFLLIKPVLDQHWYQQKNAYYGDVRLPAEADKGHLLEWAKTRENEFLSKVGLQVLIFSGKNEDARSLERCLQLLIGGYDGFFLDFVEVIVPKGMTETEVEDKVRICTAILNYHPSHYETNDPNWALLPYYY